MKLITKTQTYYLLLIAGLLFVWGAVFLLFISAELQESTDDMLDSDLETIITELEKNGTLPEAYLNTSIIQINPIPKVVNDDESYMDVRLPDPEDGEMEEFREIRTQVELNGQPYEVILRQSRVEYENLWTSILMALLIFVIVLIILIAVVNRQFLQHIWDPFYHTLDQLGTYSIQGKDKLKLKANNIDEFKALNEEIEKLLARIEDDYRRLKQFTENASHEIQTPLSVIQNQVELLSQDEKFPEDQRLRLGEINKMAGRLSRLNSALLLLTKIENEQYAQREVVDISQMLHQLITQYRELATAKEITVEEDLAADVTIKINADLSEMLFRNLLSNAIKHNYEGGSVTATLSQHRFVISNTGAAPEIEPMQLFNRFQKSNHTTDSLGLGLAIVQTIVVANNFAIDYRYKGDKHILEISF